MRIFAKTSVTFNSAAARSHEANSHAFSVCVFCTLLIAFVYVVVNISLLIICNNYKFSPHIICTLNSGQNTNNIPTMHVGAWCARRTPQENTSTHKRELRISVNNIKKIITVKCCYIYYIKSHLCAIKRNLLTSAAAFPCDDAQMCL